jgi:hypothetical protein
MRSEFIFHWGDLNSLVKRSLSDEILLVDFGNGLGTHHWVDLDLIFSLITINVELFTFFLVIVVGFFLLFKGLSFVIDLSFGKDTGLDVYLTNWFEIDIHCVTSLSLLVLFLSFLFFCLVHCVVQLCHDFWVQLSRNLSRLWSEYPLWHTCQSIFPLSGLKIVCIESCCRVLLLFFSFLSLVDYQYWVLFNIRFLSLIELHSDLILLLLFSN